MVTKHADVEVSGQTVDQTPYQTPHAKNYGPQITQRTLLSARFQYGDSKVQVKEEYGGYNSSRNVRGGWKDKVDEGRPEAG